MAIDDASEPAGASLWQNPAHERHFPNSLLGWRPMRDDDLYTLPRGLPLPEDDGAARHLAGMRMRSIELPTTRGRKIDVLL